MTIGPDYDWLREDLLPGKASRPAPVREGRHCDNRPPPCNQVV